jgi:hypothetical protein
VTVLASDAEVLRLAGPGVVVLWRVDVPFADRPDRKRLTTTLYRRGRLGSKWTRFDPYDSFARDFTYANEDLWVIATERSKTSTVSLADAHETTDFLDELEALPRHTVVTVGDYLYQNFGGEWWCMDPWADPETHTLSTKELWEWQEHGNEQILVLWRPEEAGVTS